MSSQLEEFNQLVAHCRRREDPDVSQQLRNVLGRSVVDACLEDVLLLLAVLEERENVGLVQREAFEEFQGLHKHVERLVVGLGAQCNRKGADSVHDAAIFEHAVSAHEYAVDLIHA